MRVRYHGKHWDPEEPEWKPRIGQEAELINLGENYDGHALVQFDGDQETSLPMISNVEPIDKEAKTLFVKYLLGVHKDES